MIKRYHLSILIFCGLILPFVANAQGSTNSTNTSADQLFETIPFEERLDEIPQELHGQFSQNPFGLPAQKNEEMMDLFLKAFSTKKLLADAKSAFNEKYNTGYGDKTWQWISQPETKKVLNAEDKYYSLQGIRERVVHKYELEQNPPSDERIKVIQRLSQNISAPASHVKSKAVIFRALVTAFSEINTQQSFSDTQIDGIVNNYRSQIQSQINQTITNQMLMMYHEIDNKTLNKFADFYTSDAGAWFSSATTESIHTAYENAAERFLTAIQKM